MCLDTNAPLAILGGKPAFARPLHVAQINLPAWDRVESTFKGIFQRQIFTDHGPLVRELDRKFAEALGVPHAICVTNGTIGLMLLARTLELRGEVIVPAFTFPATVQALSWAGLEPIFCDVEPETHNISVETVLPHVNSNTAAIMGVHAWGRGADPVRLERLAREKGLVLFYDACHGIGCTFADRNIGGFGAAEVFSFHATKIVNGAEGGCITTRDDGLAARLRTACSFHPSETFAQVDLRFNAKMSEAQAGFALLSLADLEANRAANRGRYEAYREGLRNIPGLELINYDTENLNNYQYVVVSVDEAKSGISRDLLLEALLAENVICRRHFFPGVHRLDTYASLPSARTERLPGTELLCQRILQLPSGQEVSVADAGRVCQLIGEILRNRDAIARHDS